MAKKRTPDPLKSAQPTATHEPLAQLEGSARELYFLKKKFIREGPAAASEELRNLVSESPDPSDSSAVASGSISLITSWLDFGDSFKGRKHGALQPETIYIEALMAAFPRDDGGSLWHKLRRFAENPDNTNNPTPGSCPFARGFDKHGRMILLKRGKPYKEGAFKTTLTGIRKRQK